MCGRNIEVLPDMAQSPAYGSFDANGNFRDGMTLRGLVPGTVIRGRMPLGNWGFLMWATVVLKVDRPGNPEVATRLVSGVDSDREPLRAEVTQSV